MLKVEKKKPNRVCGDCVHVYACSAWNCGNMYNADASNCVNFSRTSDNAKVGKWVRVTGYCTPGGDPVWACSECGKGMHVYGIEHGTYGRDIADGQWVACPNCGAKME